MQELAVGVGDLGGQVGVLRVEIFELGRASRIDGLDDIAARVVVVLHEGAVGQVPSLKPAVGVDAVVDKLAAAVRPGVQFTAGVHSEA